MCVRRNINKSVFTAEKIKYILEILATELKLKGLYLLFFAYRSYLEIIALKSVQFIFLKVTYVYVITNFT